MARALGTLPRLAQALARGEISYSKIRAVTRVATPETEERLLAVARAGTAVHVERIVRGWRRVDRNAEVRQAARQHASRGLHVYQDDDGMVIVRGRLTPEIGALLRQALTAARESLYRRATRTPRTRRWTFPRKRRRWSSSRRTRSPCWQSRRCTTGSIPPRRESGIRWWSTSMRRRSPTPTSPASRSSRTARAFPRERRSGWRATRAGW